MRLKRMLSLLLVALFMFAGQLNVFAGTVNTGVKTAVVRAGAKANYNHTGVAKANRCSVSVTANAAGKPAKTAKVNSAHLNTYAGEDKGAVIDPKDAKSKETISGERVLILRGNWANEKTHQIKMVDTYSGESVKASGWEVVEGSSSSNGFNGDAVSVTSSGKITVLKSGITQLKGMVAEEYTYITVIVPGDYNRDGNVSSRDGVSAIEYELGATALDTRDYALELLDINRDGFLSMADSIRISKIEMGTYVI